MKLVELSRGAVALIDDEDHEYVSRYSWWLSTTGYAFRTIWFGRDKTPKHKNVAMHRELFGLTDPTTLVDHINGNKLDNRRSNLRVSTKSTNGSNRGRTRLNKSGYKGVVKHPGKQRKGWIAQITYGGKNHYLGYHSTPELAACAYNERAKVVFGEYAQLNILPEV